MRRVARNENSPRRFLAQGSETAIRAAPSPIPDPEVRNRRTGDIHHRPSTIPDPKVRNRRTGDILYRPSTIPDREARNRRKGRALDDS